jgi:hypothetical protein
MTRRRDITTSGESLFSPPEGLADRKINNRNRPKFRVSEPISAHLRKLRWTFVRCSCDRGLGEAFFISRGAEHSKNCALQEATERLRQCCPSDTSNGKVGAIFMAQIGNMNARAQSLALTMFMEVLITRLVHDTELDRELLLRDTTNLRNFVGSEPFFSEPGHQDVEADMKAEMTSILGRLSESIERH